MKINTATNLISEPIFPKFTFSGKLELDNTHIHALINEINKMEMFNWNWGKSAWNNDQSQTWNMTPNISKITPLILKQLFDVLTNQYNWTPQGDTFIASGSKYKLECRRCFPAVLYPGHDMPIQCKTGQYFTGITMLSTTSNSHRPYLQNMESSVNFEHKIKCWIPENRQQIFIPDDIPWGISSGSDDHYTIALITHILRKRA